MKCLTFWLSRLQFLYIPHSKSQPSLSHILILFCHSKPWNGATVCVFYFTCDHVMLCVVMLKYSPTFVDDDDDIYVLHLGFHPVAVVSKLV